jgi:hypothetical protein
MRPRFPTKGIGSPRQGEQGQTILLVAISIVALLSMAALAIDVVTLYVAKSEIQRAADALALAGAKAVADSGVTTVPVTDTTNLPLAETLATTMATAAVNAMLSSSSGNLVSGQTPTLAAGPTIDFTTHGNNNPTVTVTLQQNNLPTFFARIWARASATTQATATAEVYNPANMQEFTPTATQCVKPWLMANVDPTQGNQPIINVTTGALEPTVAALIGNSFYLTADCNSGLANRCELLANPEKTSPGYNAVFYVPPEVGSTNHIYPSCVSGLDQYAQSVAGCDSTVYSCGGGVTNATWQQTGENPNYGTSVSDQQSDTAVGAECLMGFDPPGSVGPGLGQDEISYPSGWPGSGPQITAKSGPQNGSVVSTSHSVVTIPIIDSTADLTLGPSVTVIGFLQAFVNYVGFPGQLTPPVPADYGDVNITVMNVVGCSQTTNGFPAVSGSNATCGAGTPCPGGGNTAIPIRLITPP